MCDYVGQKCFRDCICYLRGSVNAHKKKKRKEGNEQKKGSVMRQPSGKKICFGKRTGVKGERGEVGGHPGWEV